MKSFLRSIYSETDSTKVKYVLFGLLLSGAYNISNAQISQTYGSSGSFVAPAGLTSLGIQAWGGGGGGAASGGGVRNRAGGGGGAFASSIVAITPGTTYNYIVGNGGAQGVAGGSSSFNSTSVIALGGAAGNAATGGAGGTAGGSTGTTKFSGGSGANSSNTTNHGGSGGGGSALLIANGGNGVTNLFGVGGIGGVGTGNGGSGGNNVGNGVSGAVPGGGGGGAGHNGVASGSGANGRIVITYTCPTYALTSTNVGAEVCAGTSSVISLTSTAAGLPVGSYIVSYTLGAPNAGSHTAVMTVVTAGTGSFTTVSLSVAGNTSITITNLSSSVCGNNVAVNNSASIMVRLAPVSTIAGTISVCQGATSPLVTITNSQSLPITVTYTINAGANLTINVAAMSSSTVSAPTATAGSFIYSLVSAAYQSAPNCTNPVTGTATITVNPLPTATISGTGAVCQNGASLSITFNGAGGTAPYTFTYNINGGANQTITTTSGNSVIILAATSTVGTFVYNLVSVRDASSTLCLNAQTGTATVTVIPLPTASIAGTATVCHTGAAPTITFTGAVGTAPYTFTYNINGGANQTITTTSGNAVGLSAPTTAAGTFAYNLVSVRDASSLLCLNAQTGTAIITVNALPAVNSAASGIVCSGTSQNNNLTATIGSSTFTWSRATVPGISQAAVSGQTSDPIVEVLTNTTANAINAVYLITPMAAGCAGAQFTYTATVNPRPFVSAQTQTICSATGFDVTPVNGVAGNIVPTGTLYTWSAPVVTGGITGGSAQATGQSSISQTLTNPTNAVQTATYTVTPIGPNCTGPTFTLTVTVTPKPLLANQTSLTCSEAAFTVTPVNGAGGNVIPTGTLYTWTAPVVTGGVTGGSAQATGQTSISQTLINSTNTAQTATYIVTPAGPNCTGATFNLTVTVNPKPFVAAQTQTICSGSSFSISPTNGAGGNIVPPGTSYTWSAPVVTGGMTGGSAQVTGQSAISQTLTNPTNSVQTATYTVTPIGVNCAGPTFTITITVNPRPFIAAQAQTVCVGTPFNVTPTHGTGGNIVPTSTLYTWSAPVVTGGITGGSEQTTGQTSISQVLTNPTSSIQTATYTVTPTGPNCTGSNFILTVTVNPRPVVTTLALDSACSASSPAVALTANTPSNYAWTVGNVTGGITGHSAGSGGIINQVLTNPSATTMGSVEYIVTPTSIAGSCIGLSSSILVNVYPPSIGGTLSMDGVAPPSNIKLVCPSPPANVTGGITLQADKIGSIVNWQRSTNGGANWINFPNVTNTFTYSGINTTTSYRAVIKSGSCDTAYSSVVVVSVVPTVQPSPVIATPSTICFGDTSVLSAGLGFGTLGIPANNGDFNNGNPDGWCVDGQCTGSALPAAGNNTNNAPWQETNGPKVFAGVEYDTYDNSKFAIVSGTFGSTSTSILTTPVFSLVGLPSATLNYFHAYNLNAGATISIEITTTGGTSWQTLFTASGPAQHGISGSPRTGTLQPVGISLNPYLGLPSVQIRFKYVGSANSSWAVDGVGIPTDGSYHNFLWTQVSPGPTTLINISGGSGTSIYASPATTTTYQIATSVAGCPGGLQPVTVTVNPIPTIVPESATPVCASPNAQTTTLPFSGVSANPTSYSIRWVSTPANSFNNVTNAAMPGNNANGSISINVPAGTAPNTYTGWLRVRNGNSCRSDSSSFTLVVRPRPTAAIPGVSTICQGQSASFSIPVTGSGPFSGTLTNGVSFSGISGTSIPITVSPSATTTYTWGSLTNGACASIASDLTGSHTVTVNIPPTITGETRTKTVCLHNPTGFKTVVSGTGITNSWQVDMGSGFSPIVNGPDYLGATTDTLTVLNPRIEMLFYQYRNNVTASGPCTSPAVSLATNLKIRNVWLGSVDNNWQNGANWSDGVPPSVICDTTHILDRALQPTLSTGTSSNTNLLIYSGADMTLTNQPNTYIEVAASIVNNNSVPGINALNGRLVLNGTVQPQTIKGSLFNQRTLNYLTISNTTAGGASLFGAPNTDTLYISNHLNFGNVNGRTFTTNDNLTLMSRSNRTASVGDLTNNGVNTLNIINGRVTVERWFSARKAWRFISVPTSGPQTFRSAWQEKMLASNDNRFPGYGTTITVGTPANYVANGFDFYDITGPSVKTYEPATNTYVGITNSANDMSSNRGYFTFVRGNRSSTTFNSPVTSTVLRTAGPLIQGTRPGVSVGSLFSSIANPYASPIDMRKINKPGAQEFFYLWNPNMAGGFGLGAFQTYGFDGTNYTPVPDDGTAVDNFIQSGQAFFVAGFSTAGTGTVNIEESDKEFQSNMVFRTQNPTANLKVNLCMNVNNNATVLDGMRVDFSDKGSNEVDRNDAWKLTNTSENVASLRENKFLAIERRKTVVDNDTIFVNMSGLRITPNYRWSVIMSGMNAPGRLAFLIDSYLDIQTPLALDDTTEYKFDVQNIPASYSQKRFMIVFKQIKKATSQPPVSITSAFASRKYDKLIAIDWKVEHETNVKGYTIERSADGKSFSGIVTKDPNAKRESVSNYAVNDLSPLAEDNFYRVRALLQNGQVVYSQIVKVDPLPFDAGISIFPNPVQNRTMHIKFAGQVQGNYSIVLNNKLGQLMHQSTAAINNNITSVDVRLSTYVTPGAYQLLIVSPSGETTRQQVIIE